MVRSNPYSGPPGPGRQTRSRRWATLEPRAAEQAILTTQRRQSQTGEVFHSYVVRVVAKNEGLDEFSDTSTPAMSQVEGGGLSTLADPGQNTGQRRFLRSLTTHAGPIQLEELPDVDIKVQAIATAVEQEQVQDSEAETQDTATAAVISGSLAQDSKAEEHQAAADIMGLLSEAQVSEAEGQAVSATAALIMGSSQAQVSEAEEQAAAVIMGESQAQDSEAEADLDCARSSQATTLIPEGAESPPPDSQIE